VEPAITPSSFDHRSVDDASRQLSLIAITPRLRAYLRRALRGRAAERRRALQQALVDAAVSAGEDPSPDRAWECALVSARAFVAEVRRSERHQARIDSDLQPDDIAADVQRSESLAARWELWAWEDAALSLLTPLQRTALELHEMDGLSDKQIAEQIGSTSSSVQKLRSTAKRRLRELLARGDILPPVFLNE
jgi:DNA-directed RNA polymerase specialized sigma24 family protein